MPFFVYCDAVVFVGNSWFVVTKKAKILYFFPCSSSLSALSVLVDTFFLSTHSTMKIQCHWYLAVYCSAFVQIIDYFRTKRISFSTKHFSFSHSHWRKFRLHLYQYGIIFIWKAFSLYSFLLTSFGLMLMWFVMIKIPWILCENLINFIMTVSKLFSGEIWKKDARNDANSSNWSSFSITFIFLFCCFFFFFWFSLFFLLAQSRRNTLNDRSD